MTNLEQADRQGDLEKAFRAQSLAHYWQLFRTLPAPEQGLAGRFEAIFIGPLWLRILAPRLLPLGGLRGWVGKVFSRNGEANNLLRRQHTLVEKVPMVRRFDPSCLDRQNSLVLTYDMRAPLGLRCLRDELRRLNDHCLLGLTFVDLPLLRRFPMPFLLKEML